MPIFGIFHKRDAKRSSDSPRSGLSPPAADINASTPSLVSEQDWESVSQTTHSHHPGGGGTSSANGEPYPTAVARQASSSRMKLPFLRKQATPSATHDAQARTSSSSAHRPITTSYASQSTADVSGMRMDETLRPPARISLGGQDSTRSLPTELGKLRKEPPVAATRPKTPKREKTGIMSWARERTKSRPTEPKMPSPPPAESFNLKAFRHVRPTSPSPSPQAARSTSALSQAAETTPDDLVPPARPRPRGASTASDTSQRISVAAFREAQARRSAASSPVPSFRPPSAADTLTPGRATTTIPALPPMPAGITDVGRARRMSTGPLPISIDTSEEESSEYDEDDADSDSDNKPVGRKRTIKNRPRAQTDVGHDSPPRKGSFSNLQNGTLPLPRPQLPTQSRSASPAVASRPLSWTGLDAYGKSPGSTSAHALGSRTASPAPAPKPKPAPIKRASSSSSSSSSSSNSDSDDAPLATLLGPKRPGSSASNLTPRGTQRPLIDINAILPGDRTGSVPSPLAANNAREREVADLSGLKKLAELKRKEELRLAKEEAEQRDAKVAAQQAQERGAERKAKAKPAQERDAEAKSKAKPAHPPPNFSYPHRRSSSDVVTSPKEETTDLPPRPQSRGPEASMPSPAATVSHLREPASSSRRKIVVSTVEPEPDSPQGISDDLMAALRFMDPDAYEQSKAPPPASPPPAPTSKGDKGKNLPIVPTPITRREPPPGFSVMSRPQHGQTHRTTQSSGAMSTLTTASVNSSATITPTGESARPAVSSRNAAGSSKVGKTISPPPRSTSLFILPTDGESSFTSTSTTPSVSTSTSSRSRPDPATTKYFPTKQSVSSLSSLASPISSPEEPKVPLKVAPILKAPKSTGRPRSSTMTLISQIPESAPLNPDSRASKPYIQPVSRPGTLVSIMPASPPSPTSSKVSYKPKPFAAAMRRDSPASSTGDSSSGRYPITPRDGSEVGEDDEWLRQERRKREMRVKRRSVSQGSEADFDRLAAKSRGAPEQSDHTPEAEQRRKERRRGEAKAAIELGNVLHGHGAIAADDDDDNILGRQMGQMPPMMNPMMGMGGPMAFPPGWGAPNTPGMMPQPGQFNQDATFLAAHQQAMLIAKQTYQMAVAQQAMAAAGEEWERNSNVGGGYAGSSYGGGGSVYGGGGGSAYGGGAASAYGGGGGSTYGGGAGSVYGGGSAYGGGGSSYGGGGVNPAMPMWGMGGFGMPTNPWSAPSLMVPPSGARSAYGGSFGGGAKSDYGGGGGGGRSSGWGSKSAYGESFSSPEGRPSKSPKSPRQRDSYFPAQEPGTRDLRKETSGHSTRADAGSGDSPSRRKQQEQRPGPRARTLTMPSSTPAPRPTSPSRRPQPPSSWGRFGS